ncbi:unnamed protein product [Lampetra fluviatilis]
MGTFRLCRAVKKRWQSDRKAGVNAGPLLACLIHRGPGHLGRPGGGGAVAFNGRRRAPPRPDHPPHPPPLLCGPDMVAFGVRCALMEGEQGAGGGLRARRGSRPAAQGPRRSLDTDGDDDDDAGVGDSAVQGSNDVMAMATLHDDPGNRVASERVELRRSSRAREAKRRTRGTSVRAARGSAPVTVGGGNGPPATTRVRQEADSSAVFGFTRPPALELKQQQ